MNKTTQLQQVFNFNPSNQQIRVEMIDNEPYFVAKDVCDCLGLGNVSESLRNIDEDEKLTSVVLMSGQKRLVNLVNESGLYSLIFQSRKPQARAFRKWVTSEVLPAIRKTGIYETEQRRALTCYTPESGRKNKEN
jgi:anti-repressor protein